MRIILFNKIFWLLTFFILSCGEQTHFSGSSSERTRKEKKLKSDNASSSEISGEVQSGRSNVEEVDTPSDIPKNPEVDIKQSLFAKELFSFGLNVSSEILSLSFSENSSTPVGLHALTYPPSLVWQTDLQDIGKKFTGSLYIGVKDNPQQQFNYELSVLPPQTEKLACSYSPEPVIGDIQPVEMWHWKGVTESDGSRYYITYSSPVAGDLDSDGNVEIVSIPSTNAYSYVNGPIIVLSSKTGQVLWDSYNVQDPNKKIGAEVSTTPAIADLDNDGYAEIIAVTKHSTDSRSMIIVSYKTKSILVTQPITCGHYCMPAVADIDNDGHAEIVVGNMIFNSDGSARAIINPLTAFGIHTTTLADLVPSSPGLEIIQGSQVFSNLGTLLWKGTCLGYSAVSDINKDGSQELVCIGGGTVYTYSNSGKLLWSQMIPINPANGAGPYGGGAPNIGDFNGDGNFEIGTAGGDYYVVFSHDGTILWKSVTTDRSSWSTGSTIFDFNGDGKVEVIYNDEQKLRIYDGSTGVVLWETANISGTLWEYPLILNIDETPSVEIVVSAPGMYSGTGGVRAFRDPSNRWVSSRKVWNQYSYYPELVNENLSATNSPSVPASGFRVNSQGSLKVGDKILIPDISAITPLFPDESSDLSSSPGLTFLLTNIGEADAPKGTNIKLQLVNSESKLIAETLFTEGLEAGRAASFKFSFSEPLKDIGPYFLRIDKPIDGSLSASFRECNLENNIVQFSLTALSRQ